MADEDETPTTTHPTTYAQSRQALFGHVMRAAEVALAQALDAHERIVYQIGQSRGYEQAWDEATKRFSALILEKPTPPPSNSMAQARLFDDAQSAKGVVLAIIRNSPGLRGVEIVQAAAKAGTPLNERTVRTVLHRARDKELRNDDGRWFVVEEETAPA